VEVVVSDVSCSFDVCSAYLPTRTKPASYPPPPPPTHTHTHTHAHKHTCTHTHIYTLCTHNKEEWGEGGAEQ
jgi:hypothetical protein